MSRRPPALPADDTVPERTDLAARTSSFRSTTSSAARKWPAKAGRCWSNCCRSGAPSRLPSSACGRRPGRVIRRRGAYTRIRQPVQSAESAKFEGVGEALARMAGHTYIMNAAVSVDLQARDRRRAKKPAVPSAILKYHCTELRPQGRQRRHGCPRRQGHHAGPEELPAGRDLPWPRRSPSPSKAPTS